MEPSYPPPPPAPTESNAERGFHFPGTNLFPGIRLRLNAMAHSSQLPNGKSPNFGFIVSFIFSALAGFGLSFLVEILIVILVGQAITVLFSALVEEPLKALAVTVVVTYMWKTIPNRRYGAALGAAAGLGFGVVESIKYIAQTPAVEMFLIRIITTIMHSIWSAIVGIGIFTMIASRMTRLGSPTSNKSMRRYFLLLAIAIHISWNGISLVFGLADADIIGIILDDFIMFPLSVIVLRDFLGGHFNFQNFLESEPGTPPSFPTAQPLPPPPPPPP
jgi:RsiW-degrading membrane proteinase PrsW (M82 family)